MSIEQAMQRLSALRQFGEIAFFQGLRECVKQTPHIACFKRIMPWLAPLAVPIGMPAFPGVR